MQALGRRLGTVVPDPEPASLSGTVEDAAAATAALGDLTAAGVGVAGFALGQPSLDEVFLALTGRPAEETAPTTEDEEVPA